MIDNVADTRVVQPGTFISSPLGDITALHNHGIKTACSLGDLDCIFRTEDHGTCESDLKDAGRQSPHCTGVIWVGRTDYAVHRMTR